MLSRFLNPKKEVVSRMLRAVAYARFSSELQREESIDAQLRAIRKYCDEHDIVLLATYAERVSTVPRTTVPSSSA